MCLGSLLICLVLVWGSGSGSCLLRSTLRQTRFRGRCHRSWGKSWNPWGRMLAMRGRVISNHRESSSNNPFFEKLGARALGMESLDKQMRDSLGSEVYMEYISFPIFTFFPSVFSPAPSQRTCATLPFNHLNKFLDRLHDRQHGCRRDQDCD